MPSDLWTQEMSMMGVEILGLVSIDDGVNVFKFGTGNVSHFDESPIVADIAPVAEEVRPDKYRPEIGGINVSFIDDGEIRDLIADNFFFNKLLTVTWGAPTVPELEFEGFFKGLIKDWIPSEGGVTFIVEHQEMELMTRNTTASYVNRNPIQAMRDLYEHSQIPSVDPVSFDPDTFDGSGGTFPLSHYNASRTSSAINNTVISNPTPAMKMVNEILRTLPGFIGDDDDGQAFFRPYDPSAPAVAVLTNEFVESLRQEETFAGRANEIRVLFGWKDSEGIEDIVAERDEVKQGAFERLWVHRDLAAQAESNIPGNADSIANVLVTTKWFNGRHFLPSPGPGILDTDGPGDTFNVMGPWIGSLTGARGFDDPTAVNAGLDSALGRTAILRVSQGANIEFIEIDLVSQTTIFDGSSTHVPKEQQDALETEQADIPGGTSAGGGTYGTAPPPDEGYEEVNALELRIKARGLYGTVATTFTPGGTLIVDYTQQIDYTRKMLPRRARGMVMLVATVDPIEYSQVKLGDPIEIENEVVLAFGLNGVTPADRKWEVYSRERNTFGDTPSLQLKLAEMKDVLDVGVNPGDGGDILISDPWGKPIEDEWAWGKSLIPSPTDKDPGFAVATAGLAITVSGGTAAGVERHVVLRGKVKIDLPASKRTVLFVDVIRGTIARRTVALAAADPEEQFWEIKLWTFLTDGASVTEEIDWRQSRRRALPGLNLVENTVSPRHMNPDTEQDGNLIRNGDFGVVLDDFPGELDAWRQEVTLFTRDEKPLIVDTTPVGGFFSIDLTASITGGQALRFDGFALADRSAVTDRFIPITEEIPYEVNTLYSSVGAGPSASIIRTFYDEDKVQVGAAVGVTLPGTLGVMTNNCFTFEVPATVRYVKLSIKHLNGFIGTNIYDRIVLERTKFRIKAFAPVQAAAWTGTQKITFNNAVYNVGAAWSDANNRFTATRAGTYAVHASLAFDNMGAGQEGRAFIQHYDILGVLIATDEMGGFDFAWSSGGNRNVNGVAQGDVFLLPGEFIEIVGENVTGTARNLVADIRFNYVTIRGPEK